MSYQLLENYGRGAIGMFFLVFVCYLLSTNRSSIKWKLVLLGIFAQLMFAMGVLHTTVMGQPVFWLLFGLILLYTIGRKYNQIDQSGKKVTFDLRDLLLVISWQTFFIIGIVFSPQLFGPCAALSMFISSIAILWIIFKVAEKHAELMKWGILISCMIITACVFLKVCPPDIIKLLLNAVSNLFVEVVNIGHKGTDFLFAPLSYNQPPWGYIFAIQVLPNIIFFAALSAILYYLGILQKIVFVFAYLLNKLNISGAESLSTAANIFLGQTEAPLMIRPYLEKMTRSEILCIMIGGMANTAGSVLAAYVGFLGGNDPAQQQYFALHMLSQSIMSAPAAIVVSKMLFPQAEGQLVSKDLRVPREKLGDNFLDALSIGTTDGLKLAVNVGAMLVVFTALLYGVNGLMTWIGGISHLNERISDSSGGKYTELSLQMILGYVFAPVAWLIGVPRIDMVNIGQLLGLKTILNEFVAYISLAEMKAKATIHNAKSLLMATYALSGFANFASIGIQIGGISQLAPNQRRNLTELGVKALIGGTIACLMCACIAGALFE